MGVSGCGKTSVARALAERCGGSYVDADDFHPESNKQKMAAGIPLTDEDRWPWLNVLGGELAKGATTGRPFFLACSALKQSYRDRLSKGLPELRFVYLKGSLELIRERMSQRQDHFMPLALLESQFAALEEPVNALVLDIAKPLEVMVEDFFAEVRME
ncbi:MAG: gluconokinase [Blastochloris sp.]|nr:gluconokinase [Blastochloris sp.]